MFIFLVTTETEKFKSGGFTLNAHEMFSTRTSTE